MIHPSSPSEPQPDGQPAPPPGGEPPAAYPPPPPTDPTASPADPTAPPAAYTPPTTAFPPPTTAFPPPTTAFPPPAAAYPPPPAGYPAPPPYADPYSGYAGGGYAPPPPPRASGTNGFAIASLVLGILGGVLLSVIFGIVALTQIRKNPQGGRGLAIAGLSLSGAWLLVLLILCGIGVMTDDSNDSASNSVATTTGPHRVSVYDLREGDCVGDLGDKDTVYDVPVVKCSESHEGEVFGTFELATGAWPGEDKVYSLADAGCAKRLDTYAKGPVDDLEYFPLTPVRSEWPKDRGVTCIATDPAGPRTTSLRD